MWYYKGQNSRLCEIRNVWSYFNKGTPHWISANEDHHISFQECTPYKCVPFMVYHPNNLLSTCSK